MTIYQLTRIIYMNVGLDSSSMKTKKVSLREIMEDDDSPMMAELIKKFEQQYGEELERIMGRKVSSKNR